MAQPSNVTGVNEQLIDGASEGMRYDFPIPSHHTQHTDGLLLNPRALAVQLEKATHQSRLSPTKSIDVLELVSHATEERLRNLIERLVQLCSHRCEC